MNKNIGSESNKMIGILGGGQLGSMLAIAAYKLGLKTHIYSSSKDSPAFNYATKYTLADYNNQIALKDFVEDVDIATIEFENIPEQTLNYISDCVPLYPNKESIFLSQDRFLEKNFIRQNGVEVADFIEINNKEDIKKWDFSLKPGILKTRKFGYDGKGQKLINSMRMCEEYFIGLNNVPCIIEEVIPFHMEVSTITTRSQDGSIEIFEPSRNIHKNHILHTSSIPSGLSSSLIEKLYEISKLIISKLNYIGVLSIEFFITNNNIKVNEIAPRVHNSGHWTMNGANVSQFEQHIRAISNMPLIKPKTLHSLEMLNIIGTDIHYWEKSNDSEDRKIHIYGKTEIKKGRKLGHVNSIKRFKK
ncbi:MAG: 5-(carboxyamino)imidazole ribonucleotide synthase [Rhodobiaceae bacterium]|nr:5-(carboxyamino)imidazole ribonucleotide synthase [Rhodobiaceae bacterium]